MSRSRFFTVCLALGILAGCANNTDSDPSAGILGQPPFDVLTDSIKLQPGNDELYFHRAVLLNKNNYPAWAMVDFQKAWSLKKEEAYALGISSLFLEKNPDSAILFLNTALKELPSSVLLQISLARSYDATNRTNEAMDIFNSVLRTYPDQLNVLMMKADLLKKAQDTTGLIATLEKAYSIAPYNREISYNLAYQYAEKKMPRALTLADSLIRHDTLGIEGEPYYIKGMYYSAINDKMKAIQLFNETISHDHRHLNAFIEKGKIYFEQGKIAEAQQTFQLANTVSPAFPDAYFWIGRCQEAAGLNEEAKLSYEKAYSLDKTFIEAKEAAAKL